MFADVDKKWFIVLGLIGLYIFYMLFLKEKTKSKVEDEYEKVLNSEEYKIKNQWQQ